MMKSRAVGFSEILASVCANEYSCYRDSITMITAFDSGKLEKTLEKVWGALTFLNDKTDGGFFKLRQVVDKADIKRASFYKIINGQKVENGWKSQIEGIVADKPSKVRGDRAELVMFEEAGSNPTLLKSFIQGEALVDVGGNKMGILVAGGKLS
nr:MAG TPA: Terminase large subunit [Caudoviricetes sp.]